MKKRAALLGLWLATWLVMPLRLAAAPTPGRGAEPRLQPVMGELEKAMVEPGDTLLDVAFRHRLGYQNLARLNPGVDVWIPDPGTIVQLPTRYILPGGTHDGIVINIPEMRLYDFTAPGPPKVYSAAVGDAEDPTPIGEFRVGPKRRDPAWYVPDSIRAEKPYLPPVVPPGPENPLGDRWMTIGRTTYGVHGTNNRWSIGRESTHGCVRLYEGDIEALFERIPEGTPLHIIYQPYKWGAEGNTIYLEVHPDLYGLLPHHLQAALAEPARLGILPEVDMQKVWHAVEEARGVPVEVGTLRATPSLADDRP
jgi:L,D-transpeptidase ErfK/SrfK